MGGGSPQPAHTPSAAVSKSQSVIKFCSSGVASGPAVGTGIGKPADGRLGIGSFAESTHVRSSHHGSMRAEAVARVFDVLHDIFALLEIDPLLRAQPHHELLLVRAGVDGDDAQAHGARVLDGEVAEPAAGAGEDDEVADFSVGDFEGFVDGDALEWDET